VYAKRNGLGVQLFNRGWVPVGIRMIHKQTCRTTEYVNMVTSQPDIQISHECLQYMPRELKHQSVESRLGSHRWMQYDVFLLSEAIQNDQVDVILRYLSFVFE